MGPMWLCETFMSRGGKIGLPEPSRVRALGLVGSTILREWCGAFPAFSVSSEVDNVLSCFGARGERGEGGNGLDDPMRLASSDMAESKLMPEDDKGNGDG